MNNIDELVHSAVFGLPSEQKKSREDIKACAKERGIISSSIYPLYMAIGKQEISGFTVPAINIRMMTYDTARVIFRLMVEKNIGPVVFEIARSEIEYTNQRPEEYTTTVLAAAIKENYQGPVFLQGDHYQFSKNRFTQDKNAEIEKIKSLIRESIDGGFLNIDIDASTLVDLEKKDLVDQQKDNYEMTILLTRYIRSLEPKNTTISIGGEIGHIGGKNSTVADFEAFMKGYIKGIPTQGISKVSVQTGTSHGGIPLANGTIAEVNLDFSVLQNISRVAKQKYGIAGAVQHGASTLPPNLFTKFKDAETVEIHLATGFQNTVYDTMPKTLREEMHTWTKDNCKKEWDKEWTEEQFVYKTRKKAIGPFKEKLWNLSKAEKQPICAALFDQLGSLFTLLRVSDTKAIVDKYVH